MSTDQYFTALLAELSPEARACDVGIAVLKASGPFVNNFRDGRELTIPERRKWLIGKMNERRIGRWESVTLAKLFPADMAIIEMAGGAK